MISKFELIKHPTSYTPMEGIGVIHVVGAEPSAVQLMKNALSIMDSSKMLFPYRIEADDNNLEDFSSGLYVYVTNILTKEVYLAEAICEDKVLAADMAKFIVSIELDLKRLLAHNIRCLAINSPELCVELLSSEYSFACESSTDDSSEKCCCPPGTENTETGQTSVVKLGVVPASSIALDNQKDFLEVSRQILGSAASEDNLIENFVNLCNAIYNKEGDAVQLKNANKVVEKILKNICNTNEAKMVNFVREHSQDRTFFKNFVYECLDPEQLSTKAQVTIYVKKRLKEEETTKTLGHYRLFTSKGGDYKLLQFPNGPCNVYMFMYLINHFKTPERKQPIDLKRNQDEFKKLYHDIFFGIKDTKEIDKAVREIFIRENKDGSLRSGRNAEYIKKIREVMQKQFEEYDESYLPYIMTGNTHLHIPVDKIVFDEDVKEALLSYNFV